ncbi:MAG TPA: ACT domain-containing protein [Candidatus Sulfotelmatobacter sp.]|nr:ACT domain-containing protein [Candidatus Sulfotelmatobacter sp.]
MPQIHEQSRIRHQLNFRCLPETYAIVRLQNDATLPDWAAKGKFTSITRTPDELSVVCPTESVPPSLRSPLQWRCLKLEGPFPFSQTGILLSFIEPLSQNGVPIFAISTYDTDYVLIQEEFAERALKMLQQAGHELSANQS